MDDKAAGDLSDRFKDSMQEHMRRSTPPSDDVLSHSTRLIKKRMEVMEVHKAMETCQADYANALVVNREQWKDLEKEKIKRKQHFENSDYFIKENQLKQQRALAKAARERKLAHQKTVELANLREELTALTKRSDKLTEIVKNHEIYPRYLDSVVKVSQRYQDPWQILSQAHTLVQNRGELLSSTQQRQTYADKIRAQLCQYREHKKDELLRTNNRLALLQSELDQARAEALGWENRWAHIQNTAAKKTLLLGTIKMATLNLYQTVMKRENPDVLEKPVAPDDTLTQLEKIRVFMCKKNLVMEEVMRAANRTKVRGS